MSATCVQTAPLTQPRSVSMQCKLTSAASMTVPRTRHKSSSAQNKKYTVFGPPFPGLDGCQLPLLTLAILLCIDGSRAVHSCCAGSLAPPHLWRSLALPLLCRQPGHSYCAGGLVVLAVWPYPFCCQQLPCHLAPLPRSGLALMAADVPVNFISNRCYQGAADP